MFPSNVIEKYFNENNALKFKYFIFRNISLFKNAIGFFEDILNLFAKNEILLVVFMSEIFFDISIFEKLDSTIQNNIIDYLLIFLDNIDFTKEFNYHRDMFDSIINLVNSCLNIIFFTELLNESQNEILFTESPLISLIKCIDKIILKIASVKLDKKNNILEKIFYEINYICSNFEGKIKEHVYKNDKNIFSDETKSKDGYLVEKLNKLFKQIIEFHKLTLKNINIISLINKYDPKNKNKDEKRCPVCNYFKKLVYVKSKFIYEENTYIKLYNRFFRNYYQNLVKIRI